jgi:hypothetical protein
VVVAAAAAVAAAVAGSPYSYATLYRRPCSRIRGRGLFLYPTGGPDPRARPREEGARVSHHRFSTAIVPAHTCPILVFTLIAFAVFPVRADPFRRPLPAGFKADIGGVLSLRALRIFRLGRVVIGS